MAIDDQIPAGQLPDGTPCHHEGESGTFCTRCWMNLYEARQRLLEVDIDDLPSDKEAAIQHYALNRSITISKAEIEWTAWGRVHRRPLSAIVRVRLMKALIRFWVEFFCVIEFGDGAKLTITNVPGWGFGLHQDDLYAACVRHLHRALAAPGASHVDFVAGAEPSFFMVLVPGLLTVLWAGLVGWLVTDWHSLMLSELWLLELFLLVFGLGFLYVLVRMLRATWVDWRLGYDGQWRYTRDKIPSWLLP
jgi:hypothetical protein